MVKVPKGYRSKNVEDRRGRGGRGRGGGRRGGGAASAFRDVVVEAEVWAATWAELLVEVALAGAEEALAVVLAERSEACSEAPAVPERNGAERVAAAVSE